MDDVRGALVSLGWSERWEALFAPYGAEGLVPARVIRADRGMPLVATACGAVRAMPAVRLRKASADGDMPAAGDWVALDADEGHETPLIEAVLERSSAFVRAAADGSSNAQVLAANVDTVLIVHPIADVPNVRRLERELSLAWGSGAVPVVVLAKADLSADPQAAVRAVEAVALGVDVHLTSAATGEGVDALLAYADGHHTVALIGPSGAGKSTLINALIGEDRQTVAEVRISDGRGRHTTVVRELVPLPNGGVLVDTPGLRAVGVTDDEDGVDAAFPDIVERAEGCRFRDCTHADEPDCAVRAAVEAGELPAERLASWHKLRAEVRAATVRTDARLRAEEARKGRVFGRALKRYQKDHGRE